VINQTISHYKILDRIGKGGMGVVYKAVDLRLHRTVAIKVLPPELIADLKRRKRFQSQAQAASALNHSNICTIYEIDEIDGNLFIVMEYVEGKTLREEIRQGPMEINKALDIAIQIASALEKSHRRNIVHRDIKPSNILITEENQAKVLDFGLARVVNTLPGTPFSEVPTEDVSLTEPGRVAGTLSYMSPEQISGKEVDGRSDMFSFGLLLYEMLTGMHPFASDTVLQVVASILKVKPEPVAALNPSISPELDRIVMQMLEKDREKRFSSMTEMVQGLKKFRADSTATHTTIISAQASRRLLWAVVLGLIAITIVFAVGQFGKLWLGIQDLPKEKHVAVLPFTSIGTEQANQAFCDGLMESLTSQLTQVEQFKGSLWVVPASEIRKEELSSAKEAKKAFEVNLVITGSVYRSGNEIRVNSSLIDAKTLRQLRAITIETRAGNLFELQDGAIRKITEMLSLELSPSEAKRIATGGTQDPSAYDFYLQGRGYLQRYEREENIDTAIALFKQALAQQPKYALARAGLGEAYWRKFDFSKDPALVESALSACRQALEENDQLAVVHQTMGVIYAGTGKYEESIVEFRKALELHPRNSDTYRELGTAFEGAGKLVEAEATYKKAIEIWPDSWAAYNMLGVFYYISGRYPDAEKMFLKVIEKTPDNVRGYNNLGGLYHLMGKYELATKMLQKSIQIEPTAEAYTNLGTLYFFLGEYANSVPLMEKATVLAPKEFRFWGNLGDAYRWTSGQELKAPAAYRQAIRLAEEQLSINPKDPGTRASLALYQVKLGHKEIAQMEIKEAISLAPDDVNVMFKSALVYELCGQRDEALEALKSAVKAGYSVEEIQTEPELNHLRQDARYRELTTKLKEG
jgi:serine/threonine protein kinase/tetratricopeptide (TPR) repeat protein